MNSMSNDAVMSVHRSGISIGRILRHENAIIFAILLALMAVTAIATGGESLKLVNLANIVIQSSIRGLASLGQGFVLLSANLDLSVGGMATMVALLGATSLTSSPTYSLFGTPLPVAGGIALMLFAGIATGSVNGWSVSRLRMPPLIVTLCMWQITAGIGYQVGSGRSVAGIPKSMAFFGQGQFAGIPVPVVIFFVAAACAYFVLTHTTYGRMIYAVGGSPISSYLVGIKVRRIVFTVYIISGFLAALSSLIILSRFMSASMLVATNLELDSIAACVVGGVSLFGGRGTVPGIVIGVLIIGVLTNGMNLFGVRPAMQEITVGSVIVAAVAIESLRKKYG